jgi:nucleotide-binding universal stress UspA family protein
MVTSREFFALKESVLVAVAFDRYTDALVRAGATLAHRTAKNLVLVHVCEPWLELPISKPFAGEASTLWDVTQAIEANTFDLAAGRLTEVAAMTGVATQTAVLTGRPAACLTAAAAGYKAALIIVGAGGSGQRLLPFGFSTALALMEQAPVPVMAVGAEMTLDLHKEHNKIMLADDLTEQSEGAVDFAFELAEVVADAELHHVHVNGLTLENLQAGILTAAATAHTPVTAGLSAAEVHGVLTARLGERLAERAVGRDEYIEAAGGRYRTKVTTGQVTDELSRLVETVQPDLLIFGRHHTVHRKPLAVGRVPFRAMLAERRPVVVVPAE